MQAIDGEVTMKGVRMTLAARMQHDHQASTQYNMRARKIEGRKKELTFPLAAAQTRLHYEVCTNSDVFTWAQLLNGSS